MIFNLHTVAELDEFIVYEDKLIEVYQKQIDAIPLSKTGRAEWLADFAILKGRYNRAKFLAAPALLAAHAAIKATENIPFGKLTAAGIPVDSQWNDVRDSLSNPDRTTAKGDMQDLFERLTAMGGKVDESHFPQPVATDVDLEIFKKADAAKRQIEDTTKKATSPWVIGGVLAAVGLVGAAYLGWKPFAPKDPSRYPRLTAEEEEKLRLSDLNREEGVNGHR